MKRAASGLFAFAFLSFEQDLRAARTVVIAGYSFRDDAVNARLTAASREDRRWIIINRKTDDAARTDTARRSRESCRTPTRSSYSTGLRRTCRT